MKIFVTRKIPEPGLKLLKKHHEIELNPHQLQQQKLPAQASRGD